MHYKNGRPAQNGDKVIHIRGYGQPPLVGILYDATVGNNTCNGKLALVSANDPCPNLAECVRADDVDVKPYDDGRELGPEPTRNGFGA